MKDRNEQELRQRIVGSFLKESREKAGFTQASVAKELGYLSAQFVSNWERGTAMPPMNILPELVRLFAISPKEFLKRLHEYQEVFLAMEKECLRAAFKTRFRDIS